MNTQLKNIVVSAEVKTRTFVQLVDMINWIMSHRSCVLDFGKANGKYVVVLK